MFKFIKRKWKKFKNKGVTHVKTNVPPISIYDLKTGDIILFYHGNKLTEMHGHFRRAKLGKTDLVPYHAAMMYEHSERQTYIVDPEIRTTASLIDEYMNKSSVRIEVIRYPVNDIEREKLYLFCTKAIIEEHYYDARGYGSFISDMPGLGWTEKIIDKIKWLQPSKKTFFCSDFDASAFAECVDSCKVSARKPNKTAPIDLLLYAIRSKKAHRYLLKSRFSG